MGESIRRQRMFRPKTIVNASSAENNFAVNRLGARFVRAGRPVRETKRRRMFSCFFNGIRKHVVRAEVPNYRRKRIVAYETKYKNGTITVRDLLFPGIFLFPPSNACPRPSGLFRRAKREQGVFSFHTVFDDNNAFRHGTNTIVIEFPVRIVSYGNADARAQIENTQT